VASDKLPGGRRLVSMTKLALRIEPTKTTMLAKSVKSTQYASHNTQYDRKFAYFTTLKGVFVQKRSLLKTKLKYFKNFYLLP
jgi:hypothetical protein